MASTAPPPGHGGYQRLRQPRCARLQQYSTPPFAGSAAHDDGGRVLLVNREAPETAPFAFHEGPFGVPLSARASRDAAATVRLASPSEYQDAGDRVVVREQLDPEPPALQYVVQTRRNHKRTPSQKKTCCRAVGKAMERLEERYQSYADASLAIGDGPRASQRPYIRRPPPCVFFPALQRRAPEEGMYVVEMARKQLDRIRRGIVELPQRICGGPPRAGALANPGGRRMWRVDLQPSVVYEGDAPELIMLDEGLEQDVAAAADPGGSGHYVVSQYAEKTGQPTHEMQPERRPMAVYAKTNDMGGGALSFRGQQEVHGFEPGQPEPMPVTRSVVAAAPEITRVVQERGEAPSGGVVAVTETEEEKPSVLHHHHHYHYAMPHTAEYEVAPVAEVESEDHLSGGRYSTQQPAGHYVSVQQRGPAEGQEHAQQATEKTTSRSAPQTPPTPRNFAHIEGHEGNAPAFYVVPTHTPRAEKDGPPITAVQAFSAEQLKEYLSSTKPEDTQTSGAPTAFLISPIPSGSSIVSRQPIKVHSAAPDATAADPVAERRPPPATASVQKDGAVHDDPEKYLSGQQTAGYLATPRSDRAHRKMEEPKNFAQMQGSETFLRASKPASFASVAEATPHEDRTSGAGHVHGQYRVVPSKDVLQESSVYFAEEQATGGARHPGEASAYVSSRFPSQPILAPSVAVQPPRCRTPVYPERGAPCGYGPYTASEVPGGVVYVDSRASGGAPPHPARVMLEETGGPPSYVYAGQEGAAVASAPGHVVRTVPSGGFENVVRGQETTYEPQERSIVVQAAPNPRTPFLSAPSLSVTQCSRPHRMPSVVIPQNSEDVPHPMISQVIRSRTPVRRTSRSLSRSRDSLATPGPHRSVIRSDLRPATPRLMSQPRLQIVTDWPPRPSRKWEVIGPL